MSTIWIMVLIGALVWALVCVLALWSLCVAAARRPER